MFHVESPARYSLRENSTFKHIYFSGGLPDELSLDELIHTFGRRIHYLGLIGHSKTVRADNRLFVGTADFLEHDISHGHFSLHPPVPGEPEDWIIFNEEYRAHQAQIADPKKRLLNSLVYFHFSHESAYKSLVPDEQGNPPKHDAYKKELDVMIKRLNDPNDYEWITKPGNIGENYLPLLKESFAEMSEFFKAQVDKIYTKVHQKEQVGYKAIQTMHNN